MDREEVQNSGRFSIKQYGYSHRLLIADLQPRDEGVQFTAVVGSDKVSVNITVTGGYK